MNGADECEMEWKWFVFYYANFLPTHNVRALMRTNMRLNNDERCIDSSYHILGPLPRQLNLIAKHGRIRYLQKKIKVPCVLCAAHGISFCNLFAADVYSNLARREVRSAGAVQQVRLSNEPRDNAAGRYLVERLFTTQRGGARSGKTFSHIRRPEISH